MDGERKVNTNCVNAGNPFHQCSDYCGQRSSQNHPKHTIDGGGKSPGFNGGGISVDERIVDPDCVNASNPFHQCAEYCVKKATDSKKQGSGRLAFPISRKLSTKSYSSGSDGAKSGLNGSVGVVGRNVNPECVNVGNPFHQCGDYCNKKATDARKQIRIGSVNLSDLPSLYKTATTTYLAVAGLVNHMHLQREPHHCYSMLGRHVSATAGASISSRRLWRCPHSHHSLSAPHRLKGIAGRTKRMGNV